MSKPYWLRCATGKALRLVAEEALPQNVHILRRPDERASREAFINAGKAYCREKCGGCPMTEDVPPA